ncbi:MAG: DUF4157 domain-containing protein [Pseudomonadota bacterium]|uniref:eCIS core domain-containing protein n=1 Tax=Burkholderiaceae TaxID=119060 RepID=UPI0010F7EF83|nr:DUF4157 domain-containing protein [Burkholderia sp. 4M9327F10]
MFRRHEPLKHEDAAEPAARHSATPQNSPGPKAAAPQRAPSLPADPGGLSATLQAISRSPRVTLQRAALDSAFGPDTPQRAREPAQPPAGAAASNRTGMPDDLKRGVEAISGVDLSDVRVHFNSPAPATLQAHAYAQGNHIHLAPGQEHHLPHESWHVVQQKQGRVRANLQLQTSDDEDEVHDEGEEYDLDDEQDLEASGSGDGHDADYDDSEPDDVYDDIDAQADAYMERFSSPRAAKRASEPRRPPSRPKIPDRHKNRRSDHKTTWAAFAGSGARAAPVIEGEEGNVAEDAVREDDPAEAVHAMGFGPEIHRGRKSRAPGARLGMGRNLEPAAAGPRTGLIGWPQTTGREVLHNVMSGEAPLRPELGQHGHVSWASVTHHGDERLPSLAYSGRDDPANATATVSFDMDSNDRHISAATAERIYTHHASQAFRHARRKNKGEPGDEGRRALIRQASVRTFKTLGVHGEKGPGLTTMSIPGNSPLSSTAGEFVVMPQQARERMWIEGQERYAKPHGRRPRRAQQDGSDMAAFLGTLEDGAYEQVNDRADSPPGASKKRRARRKRGAPRDSRHGRDNRPTQRKLHSAGAAPAMRGVAINTDTQLEREADVMGALAFKAGRSGAVASGPLSPGAAPGSSVQRKIQFGAPDHLEVARGSDLNLYRKLLAHFDANYAQRKGIETLRDLLFAYAADERTYTLEGLVEEYFERGARLPGPKGGDAAVSSPTDKPKGLISGDTEGERLGAWLKRSPETKDVSGAKKHRELLGNLKQDLAERRSTRPLNPDNDAIAVTAGLQYLAHNASHLPHSMTGKVQRPESWKPLYYFRSQSQKGSVHESFNDQMVRRVRPPVKAIEPGAYARMPDNDALLDEAGVKGDGGPVRAAFGGRRNNVFVYQDLVTTALHEPDDSNLLGVTEEQYGPLPEAPRELAPTDDLRRELSGLRMLGRREESQAPETSSSSPARKRDPLAQSMLDARRRAAEAVARTAAEGKGSPHFNVYNVEGNPNLHIRLTNAGSASADYPFLVDAAVAYLGGLLNFLCKSAGIPVFTLRRQSFGFMTPTLTDTDQSIRLSMGGLQPDLYVDVVLHALSVMDAALTELDGAFKEEGGVFNAGLLAQLKRYLGDESRKVLVYQLAEAVFARQGSMGFARMMLYIAKHNHLDMLVEYDRSKREKKDAEGEKTRADQEQETATGEFDALRSGPRNEKWQTALSRQSNAKKASQNAAATVKLVTEKFKEQKGKVGVSKDTVLALRAKLEGKASVTRTLPGEVTPSHVPSPVAVQLLEGVLTLVSESAAQIEDVKTLPFANSWRFAAQTLINNAKKANVLLLSAGTTPAGMFEAKTLVLVDNLLEALVLFRSFSGLNLKKQDPEAELHEQVAAQLLLPSKVTLEVLRTDSGEQAGAISLLAFIAETKAAHDDFELLHDKPYFELVSAIKTIGEKLPAKPQSSHPGDSSASISTSSPSLSSSPVPSSSTGEASSSQSLSGASSTDLSLAATHSLPRKRSALIADLHPGEANLDISGVQSTKDRFLQLIERVRGAKIGHLVVDITNADIFEAKVLDGVRAWISIADELPKRSRLVLFASLLKHKQMGLDKYQAGRLFVFTANGESSPSNREFDRVIGLGTEGVKTPLIDDYLAMMDRLGAMR